MDVTIINPQADYLFVSDPKAMQYIFTTSGYNFQKQPERREVSRIHSGRGLVWADGKFFQSSGNTRYLGLNLS